MAGAEDRVLVVGAGVVGICCALALQRRGHRTAIIDPQPPGSQASYGNAGGIAVSEVLPMAVPDPVWKLPMLLLDPLGPVSFRWNHLPSLLPWFWRFVRASTPVNMQAGVKGLAALMATTYQDLLPLLDASGTGHLLVRKGALSVYENDAAFRADANTWELKRSLGIDCQELSAKALRAMEPDLSPQLAKAVFIPDWSHLRDPHGFVRGCHDLFVKLGGDQITDRVVDFRIADGKVGAARTEKGNCWSFNQVVIAAGAWSGRLANCLGSKVPLESERGYNTTLPSPGVSIHRAIIFAERNFVMTPMDMGLRIGGAAEFAGLDADPNFARSKALLRLAKRYVPALNECNGREWMGQRPSLPDSLPVISRSPHHPNVLMAFGHGHLGLTQAATTARLIADLASNQSPSIDMTPYRVDRF